MVPRADIVAVEEKASLDQVVRLFTSAGHSRLPVYREKLDDVIGMAHIKDLMRFWGSARKFELSQLVRRVLIVPPSMRLLDLLLEMRAKRVHMALVVDEYGGVDGLATIEDAVEQIVGDIHDEHDDARPPSIIERPDGTLEAEARCAVEDLEERLQLRLIDPEREEYVDTLGGLLFSLTGRIPQRGELIKHPTGLAFEVIDADPRRVKRVRIRNIQPAKAPPAP
jgi:CBS domain containing-hemolysin-like protein